MSDEDSVGAHGLLSSSWLAFSVVGLNDAGWVDGWVSVGRLLSFQKVSMRALFVCELPKFGDAPSDRWE
jgi:hypothetical protein